ncbi:MAG: DUF6515 family protein [Verrucomicrobiota bacterium]
MNNAFTTPLFAGCLAIGSLLTSCVDPYAGGGYAPTQTVTTYRTGYEVRSLPPGYRTEVIGGTRYYSQGGTYYQPRSGRYVVVEAPRNRGSYDRQYSDRQYNGRDRDRDRGRPQGNRDVIVTKLPPGSRPVKYRGGEYYQVRDVYYQRRGAGYVVVSRPY